MSRAKVLYFLMGTAAVLFASADTIAQFDRDPNTKTATNWVKDLRGRNKLGLLAVLAGLAWVVLHMLWDGFPL